MIDEIGKSKLYKDNLGRNYYVLELAEDFDTGIPIIVYHELFGDYLTYTMSSHKFKDNFYDL